MARRSDVTPWPTNARRGDLVPRRRESVHGVEIDSESVLYDEKSGRLHLLNWSAGAVWWSIDGTSSADALAEDLAGRFGESRVSVASMRGDVMRLLAMLGSQELIETVRPRETER